MLSGVRWNGRHSNRERPFSGEDHGTSGLCVRRLLQLLRERNLSKFGISFVEIGENDMMYLSNHQLMYTLVDIVRECQREGVRRIMFGTMLQRLDHKYNKRAKRLNMVLRKLQKRYLWEHGPGLINNDVIDPKDKIHLRKSAERLFALSYLAKNY